MLSLPLEKRTSFNRLGNPVFCRLSAEAVQAVCSHGGDCVRLLVGVAKAFGLLHIEEHHSRMMQIQGFGYRDAHQYVQMIMNEHTRIAVQADGRINLLVDKHGYWHHLICEWDSVMDIWSVTTAIPKRHARNLKIVWTR